MSQNDPKTTPLMTSLTKNPQPQPKFFFRVQTSRSIWILEQLYSAIGGGAIALVGQPRTAGVRLKSRYNIFVDQTSKC